MELTLLDQIEAFVSESGKVDNLENIIETIKYININNPDRFYTNISIEDVFTLGINPSEYKREIIKTTEKERLKNILTTNKFISRKDVDTIEMALKAAKKLMYDYTTEYAKLSQKKARLSKDSDKNKLEIETINEQIKALQTEFNIKPKSKKESK